MSKYEDSNGKSFGVFEDSQDSKEYRLRVEITRLTRENLGLRIDNDNLIQENGRLKRTIEKMLLNKKDLP